MKRISIAGFFALVFCFFINSCLAYDSSDVLRFPLEGYSRGGNIWGSYNFVGNNKYHLGEDVYANAGMEVYAIGNGKVMHAMNHPLTYDENNSPIRNYGGMYIIEHTLSSGEKICSLYAHLNFATFTKSEGQDVDKGEYLGKIGTTAQNGGWSEHLHLGILKGEYPSNPNEYICGDWVFSGYSACENVRDDWHSPKEFIETRLREKVSARCIGDICWEPSNEDCYQADRWFDLRYPPYLQSDGVCDQIYDEVEYISQSINSATEVPEEHFWQSWWRSLIGVFGKDASAYDIMNYSVIREVEIPGAGSDPDVDFPIVVSGNGATINDTTGYGFLLNPTELPEPDLPDFIVDELQLQTPAGVEQYQYEITDEIKMHAWFDNIGEANWEDGNTHDDIEVRFYLSDGYKEDSRSDWIHVGTDFIQKENIQISDPPKHEEEGLKIWEYNIDPGVYNIVACADRTEDQDNGDGDVLEEHKSNNCSTEAVFVIKEPNHEPEGYLDTANCDNIAGWTRDANTTNAINVHFYADGSSDTGTFIGSTLANGYRGDLPFDDLYHGFVFTTPESLKDGNQHTIYAYGIDDRGGINPLLLNSPKTINNCFNFVIRADVDHDGILDIDDFMMTFDVALRYDRTSQGWVDTPTTGDVNCDGQVTTTDSMLISRKVYGQDMRGTAWCDEDFPEVRADVNQDGSINTADAMLISQKVAGFDMSGTAWVETISTGDVNCDLPLDSADTNLAMQKAMGFDMSGTAWCGGE